MALEAETAINRLPVLDLEHTRRQVATNLKKKKLYKPCDTHKQYNIQDLKEKKILNQIKEKLEINNATISKADKANCTVIISTETYREK